MPPLSPPSAPWAPFYESPIFSYAAALCALFYVVLRFVLPCLRHHCVVRAPKSMWHVERSADDRVIVAPSTSVGECGGYVGVRVSPQRRGSGVSKSLARSNLPLSYEATTPLPKLDCNKPNSIASASNILPGLGESQLLPLQSGRFAAGPLSGRLAASPSRPTTTTSYSAVAPTQAAAPPAPVEYVPVPANLPPLTHSTTMSTRMADRMSAFAISAYVSRGPRRSPARV